MEWPVTIYKIKCQNKLIRGERQCPISRIFSLFFWQLGLNREIAAVAAFLVSSLGTFDSQWSSGTSGFDQEIRVVCACVG